MVSLLVNNYYDMCYPIDTKRHNFHWLLVIGKWYKILKQNHK